MFKKLTHILTISAVKSLLKIDENSQLSTAKRLISIVAGAYVLQRGLRNLTESPLMGVQETVMGGLLIYNGATGMEKSIARKPKRISEMRKNQIQGNDPDCDVPAFV